MDHREEVGVIVDERLGLPSASSMYRVDACAGSENLIRTLEVKETTSEVAQSGTEIHDALYTGVDWELDEEQLAQAEALRGEEQKIVEAWEAKSECYAIDKRREERIWIRDRNTLIPIASAKLDFFCVSGVSALTIDYKTGFLPVTPAERNWQLRVQAIALVHEYPHVKHVRVAIAVASLNRADFDYVDYTEEDLQHAERDLLHNLWKSKQPDANRQAGDWCRYCPAKAFCREAAAWASVDVVQANQQVLTKESAALAVAQMTPEQLAVVWRKRGVIEAIQESIKERLKTMDEAQLKAIGIGLRDGKLTRKVELNPSSYNTLLNWIEAAQLLDSSKLSIEKLTTHFAARNQLSKKDAKAKLLEILAEYTTEERGEPILKEL